MEDISTASPKQIAAHNDHKARLQRIAIAARAVSARPVAAAPPPPPPIATPEQPPAPTTSPWFHIVGFTPKLGRITVEQVKMAVCREFDVRHSNLISQRRTAGIVRVRQIGMYLAKELTTRSLPEIGRRFGRDHTTVLHAVRKVARLVATDAELAARIKALRVELGDGE